MLRISCCLVLSLTLLLPYAAFAQPDLDHWPTQYGGIDASANLDGVEREALEALGSAMRQRGAEPCRSSTKLVSAARIHAKQLLQASTSSGRISVSVVRREVLRAGGVDPVVIPWAEAFSGTLDLEARRARLAKRFGARPPTHCGVGMASVVGRSVVVVIGVRRHVSIDPFPAQVARGERVRLQGRLVAGYHAPSVLVTTPRGDVIEQQTLRRSGSFGSWLGFPLPGRYTVEVMANGPQGPEIVALFPVYVDAEPSMEGVETLQSSTGDEARPETPSSILLGLLNEERHRAGLDLLERDPSLSRLATDHCRDMVRQSYFGHLSPSGRDLTSRLRQAGISTHRAAENLARSSTGQRAHAQLMESPSHRANILDPDLTHIGIGVAEREGELLVTQIFVAW